MAEEEAAAERKDATKDGTERRVYNLPASLLARLRAYQVTQGIPSEVEAARRLLDYALQMRDSVFNILQTLDARFAEERDLRVLASDVLTKHVLVTQVAFDDTSVSFTLRNGQSGRMTSFGHVYYSDADDSPDYWRQYNKSKGKFPHEKEYTSSRQLSAAPNWEPVGGDLDDEIPF